MLLTSTFSENVLRWNPQKTLNSSFQQTLLEFLFIGTKFEQENMIRSEKSCQLVQILKSRWRTSPNVIIIRFKVTFPPFHDENSQENCAPLFAIERKPHAQAPPPALIITVVSREGTTFPCWGS